MVSLEQCAGWVTAYLAVCAASLTRRALVRRFGADVIEEARAAAYDEGYTKGFAEGYKKGGVDSLFPQIGALMDGIAKIGLVAHKN